MKLLSVAIPSYNSQDYLAHCVESLLPGGDEVEILIVDDGSKDDTARIADEYEARYPGIVRAIHKENGGHGDAVMTGLHAATGLYFKVVDSDDWVDEDAYPKVLNALRGLTAPDKQLDMLVCNYIYDKVGVTHKRVISYGNALPEGKRLTWDDVGRFHVGQYILMHAVIYRRQLLLDCGLTLPKHTFYVDSLYVYVPMQTARSLMYLNLDLYHYYIGRSDQSVNEQVMIKRYDQQIRVNKMMLEAVDPSKVAHKRTAAYLFNYFEIITIVSSVLAIISGSDELMQKKDELWAYIEKTSPATYKKLRSRIMGALMTSKSPIARRIAVWGYHVSQRLFGFN